MTGLQNILRKKQLETKNMEELLRRKDSALATVENYLDDVYELTLYYDPMEMECQKMQAILNYYKISYKRVLLSEPRTTTESSLNVWELISLVMRKFQMEKTSE